jgi:hypothetical protein
MQCPSQSVMKHEKNMYRPRGTAEFGSHLSKPTMNPRRRRQRLHSTEGDGDFKHEAQPRCIKSAGSRERHNRQSPSLCSGQHMAGPALITDRERLCTRRTMLAGFSGNFPHTCAYFGVSSRQLCSCISLFWVRRPSAPPFFRRFALGHFSWRSC